MKIGETISARLGGCYERWRPVLGVLERELLVFPLAVVLLVTATFWFGGTCALWQTWGGRCRLFGGGVGSPSLMARARPWYGALPFLSRSRVGSFWVLGRECF